jgi:hypothetical protein
MSFENINEKYGIPHPKPKEPEEFIVITDLLVFTEPMILSYLLDSDFEITWGDLRSRLEQLSVTSDLMAEIFLLVNSPPEDTSPIVIPKYEIVRRLREHKFHDENIIAAFDDLIYDPEDEDEEIVGAENEQGEGLEDEDKTETEDKGGKE